MNQFFLKPLCYVLAFIVLFLCCSKVQAIKNEQQIIVCESSNDLEHQPSFNESDCQVKTLRQLNPQGKQLWVKIDIEMDPTLLNSSEPLGFFIHGKASSEVYLNGHLIGKNGHPSVAKNNEIAGMMDVVFYVPRTYILDKGNQLILKMSAHHGWLHLKYPINWMGFSAYINPSAALLKHYWLSLLPLGAFIIAAIYFSILSFNDHRRLTYVFCASMAFFVTLQLLAEISRGIIDYQYPMQDIRLMIILFASFGFGLSLFLYIALKFLSHRIYFLFSILCFFLLISIFVIDGFDFKSMMMIFLPTLAASFVCGYAIYKKQAHAKAMIVVLVLFMLVLFVDASDFLDTNFYYVIASLMLFLFTQQAIDHANDKKIRAQEKTRADQLQLILDQHQQQDHAAQLKISGAGQVDQLKINDIIYCKAAGDYVELVTQNNDVLLHNSSLKNMDKTLPGYFLKVHRSYIVNTNVIRSLKRKNSGTGELLLINDYRVPISRRIMPKVREKLL